jgi:hypothetical protein
MREERCETMKLSWIHAKNMRVRGLLLIAIVSLIISGCGSDSCGPDYHCDVCDSEVRQVTSGLADDGSPAWSPDGSEIAFTSACRGHPSIWIVPAIGGIMSQITGDPAGDASPAWSPDGTLIAFTSRRSGNLDVWVICADGDGPNAGSGWGIPTARTK